MNRMLDQRLTAERLQTFVNATHTRAAPARQHDGTHVLVIQCNCQSLATDVAHFDTALASVSRRILGAAQG